MRSIVSGISLFLVLSLLFTACKKDDKPPVDGDKTSEFKFIRLAVSHVAGNTLTLVNPVDHTTTTFTAAHSNATLYPTASRRFAALLFGSQNHVQFFDCGFEYHGDHVDVKGTPKFAAMTSSAPKPTHFKSRGAEILIFNDGDGTLSVADENDFHSSGSTMKIINAGLAPHHGAMAQFDDGNYAVTFTDPNSTGAGPHGVKIINANGQEVHASKLAVSRLHGNATDGVNALFGVDGGILVVKNDGNQRVIPNPDGFGTVRLGTVLEAAGVNKFIGYSAAKGAYFIDINTDKIIPIIESTDIMQCKIDYAGKNLIVLMHDGTLHIYDLSTGVKKKEGKIIAATVTTETVKPIAEATSKYVYITMPANGELLKVNVNDFSDIVKIKVSAQPSKLAILGFETDEAH